MNSVSTLQEAFSDSVFNSAKSIIESRLNNNVPSDPKQRRKRQPSQRNSMLETFSRTRLPPINHDKQHDVAGWVPFTSRSVTVDCGLQFVVMKMNIAGETYRGLIGTGRYFAIEGIERVLSTIQHVDLADPHFDDPHWRSRFNDLRENQITPMEYDLVILQPKSKSDARVITRYSGPLHLNHCSSYSTESHVSHFVATDTSRFRIGVSWNDSLSSDAILATDGIAAPAI